MRGRDGTQKATVKRLVYNKGTLWLLYRILWGPRVHPLPVTFTIYDNVEMIYCKCPSPSLTVYNHFYRKLNLYIKFPSCTYPGCYSLFRGRSVVGFDGGMGSGRKNEMPLLFKYFECFVKQLDTGPLVLFKLLRSRAMTVHGLW